MIYTSENAWYQKQIVQTKLAFTSIQHLKKHTLELVNTGSLNNIQ